MAAPKEGGFKMSLGKLKAKPGIKPLLPQKDAKKARLALGDDETDDSTKQQEILGWDAAAGGALEVGAKKKEEVLRIIPAQSNRDWRAEARRKILSKAPHNQEQAQKSNVEEKEREDANIQYGLTIINKEEREELEAVEAPELMDVIKDTLTEEQRLEKKALDALLTGKSNDEELIIPVQTEEEAFADDLHNAPEAPTLEAYEAQPIEGFGAALLRGMGWKDGEAFGKNGKTTKTKEVKRRPALLGIGAKEEAAVGVELGAWGPKNGKGKKAAQSYNPVALRNKRTGEIITEDELKAKLESQNMVPEEKPSKSRSKYNDDDEEEDGEKRRDRRRDDRDRERRREETYDSERRRDKDHSSHRQREKDNYDSSDRRRDKRRGQDRDDEYDGERRRDRRRDRSRSPDAHASKRKDRHRSRSRDNEDRRDRRKERDRRDRSRSRNSDDRRKRRRDREYDDDREDRKRRY